MTTLTEAGSILVRDAGNDVLLLTLRVKMPPGAFDDFDAALRTGTADAVLTWAPTSSSAVLSVGTGDDRREVCAFANSITS